MDVFFCLTKDKCIYNKVIKSHVNIILFDRVRLKNYPAHTEILHCIYPLTFIRNITGSSLMDSYDTNI